MEQIDFTKNEQPPVLPTKREIQENSNSIQDLQNSTVQLLLQLTGNAVKSSDHFQEDALIEELESWAGQNNKTCANISLSLLEVGSVNGAFKLASKGVAVSPDDPMSWGVFQHICCTIGVDNLNLKPTQTWKQILIFGLEKGYFCATKRSWSFVRKILGETEEFLKLKDSLDAGSAKSTSVLELAFTNQLLCTFLSRSATSDIETEELLKKLRFRCLQEHENFRASDSFTDLLSSIALTSFWNEFIIEESSEEKELIDALLESTKSAVVSTGVLDAATVALLGAYRRLDQISWLEHCSYSHTTSRFEKLIHDTIKLPLEELKIKGTIERIGEIEDKVSLAVQEQYERYPYPVWETIETNTVNGKISIPKILAAIGCSSQLTITDNIFQPKILIAGCGTGQQVLSAAHLYENSGITAIDLSRSSLAYAIRKSAEAGLTDINYYQADIMSLGEWAEEFDLIESCGVIHHTSEPFSAWRILSGLLTHGGVMKIAVYSEAARVDLLEGLKLDSRIVSDGMDPVKAARNDLISQTLDLTDTYDNLAQSIQRLPERHAFRLPDFFATSECKDLLLHEEEHLFSIPKISECLEMLELDFLGFELPHLARLKFISIYGEESLGDLDKWTEFEKRYPETFAGMYQIWMQKRPNA